jgi:hypothetical protein
MVGENVRAESGMSVHKLEISRGVFAVVAAEDENMALAGSDGGRGSGYHGGWDISDSIPLSRSLTVATRRESVSVSEILALDVPIFIGQ